MCVCVCVCVCEWCVCVCVCVRETVCVCVCVFCVLHRYESAAPKCLERESKHITVLLTAVTNQCSTSCSD